MMKTNCMRVSVLPLAAACLMFASGCVVEPDGRVVFQPVVVAPPPPVVVATPAVVIPDDYVWDGYEYIGVVGGQCFYLGAGNVWFVCDSFRSDRFHSWQGGHPGWHQYAVRNDRYRTDHNGHYHPRHD